MGTGDTLISIVVPVYGTEAYLPQCVESLLAQTHSHLELILIDDGSPDHCGTLCDRYGEQDRRILVIHQENQGVSAARNAGVKAAHGQYIAFVDSDDWVEPDYLVELLQAAEQSEADAVVEVSGAQVCVWTGPEALRQLCYQKQFDTAPWGKLFRTELAQKTPFPEVIFFEDLAAVCRMIGGAQRVAGLSGMRYHYRQNPKGTMNGGDVRRLLDELRAADMMYDYAKSVLDSDIRAAESRKFSAYCQVLMKLPRDGYDDVRAQTWDYLRRVRGTILRDRNARMKNRMAALLTWLGEPLMRLLWSVTT